MKKIILLFSLLTLTLSYRDCIAQGFKYVSPDNDFACIIPLVHVSNGLIYTQATTINTDSVVPYVGMSLIKFDFNGNIIFDSLVGNLDTTFVLRENSKYYNSSISSCGEVRFPNQTQKPYEQFTYFIDSSFTNSFCYVYPYDSTEARFSVCGRKISANRYCTIYQIGPPSGGATLTCRIFIIDSLKNIINQKEITNTGFWLRPNDIYLEQNYYYLMLDKQLINQSNNPCDIIIYKMDTLLNVVDSFKTNTHNWYGCRASAFYPNGDFVIGGIYSDAFTPPDDLWQQKYISKFDKNLNLIWTRKFGRRSLNTGVSKLMITSTGDIVGVGIDGIVSVTVNGDTIGHITGCIFKFNTNGDSLWFHNYQAIDDPLYGDNNELLDVDEMPDGGFVACGKAEAFNPYRRRGWVIRVDADGCLIPGCINAVKEIESENEFIVYPNPADESLNITNVSQISSYQVFQFDGKLIERGISFPLKISEFNSGIYFLQINTKSNQYINRKFMKQ